MSIRIYINTFRMFCTNVMLNYYHTTVFFSHVKNDNIFTKYLVCKLVDYK